jgi:hypothetical protein
MAIRSTRPRLLFAALAFASLASAAWGGGPGGGGAYYGGFGGGIPGQGNSNNNNNPSVFFNGPNNGNNGFSPGETLGSLPSVNFNKAARARLAHGILASLAMVFFFPLGGIAIRILPGPLAILIHATLQLFGYLLFTAAVGLGLWIAVEVRFGNFNFVRSPSPGQVQSLLLTV